MPQCVKKLPTMQETQEMQVWSLGQEDPLEKTWQPTLVFLPEKSHGQRSLGCYSPKDDKELDRTKLLSTNPLPHRRRVEVLS